MVRPECYQCARCGEAWSAYYPRTVCKCGADVLRRVAEKLIERLDERRERIEVALADIADGGTVGAFQPLPASAYRPAPAPAPAADAWSPYPAGNGDEGYHVE